jgi:hypothetical protein
MNIRALTIAAAALTFTAVPALAKKPAAAPSWLAKAKADCTERVVSDYGVDAGRVVLGKNHDDAKGLLNIPGKVDKGTDGIKSFMCKFNSDGALIDVMSMTSDGAL